MTWPGQQAGILLQVEDTAEVCSHDFKVGFVISLRFSVGLGVGTERARRGTQLGLQFCWLGAWWEMRVGESVCV